jgi:hypothetical protein
MDDGGVREAENERKARTRSGRSQLVTTSMARRTDRCALRDTRPELKNGFVA